MVVKIFQDILRSNKQLWSWNKCHSRLRQFLMKFQVPETKTTQTWSVCFKDSKNVLNELHSEPLMHTLSSCEGPFQSNFNFIFKSHSTCFVLELICYICLAWFFELEVLINLVRGIACIHAIGSKYIKLVLPIVFGYCLIRLSVRLNLTTGLGWPTSCFKRPETHLFVLLSFNTI